MVKMLGYWEGDCIHNGGWARGTGVLEHTACSKEKSTVGKNGSILSRGKTGG